MNLLSKFKRFFGPSPGTVPDDPTEANIKPVLDRIEIVESRYEGSYQYFGERSLIPATYQDSRFDASPGVRKSLAEKSRYWERNSAIMQAIIDRFEQYVAGATGLRIIPNSSDPAWNAKASAWWKDFSIAPEVDSFRTLAETMTLCARTWFVDGEVFILKTADAKGAPKIQLIESHRVATPTQYADLEGTSIVDGVEVNAVGTPVAYYVRKADTSSLMALGNTLFPYLSSAPEEFERIPASRMVHIFEAVRPGLTRGLPFNYAVLNDLHDFEDLQLEEMKAVKAAADMALVWHTKTGEPVDPSSFRRVNRNIQTTDAAGNAVVKTSALYYDATQGGRDRYLKPGEDVKQFATERPTVATENFWQWLLSKICAGCGVSKLLVFPYSNQGTVVRSDLETSARFFVSRSTVLAQAFINVYAWAISWGADWDRRLTGAPKDFARALVRPPRSVNVDLGRNSAAMLAELEAGLRTRSDIWAESGDDWREQTEELWVEAAFFEEMEKKYGIPREKVLTLPQLAPIKPATNGNGAAAHVPIKINEKENHFANGSRF